MASSASDRSLDINAAIRGAIEGYDWGATPLGPQPAWPGALKTVLGMVLDTPFAMLIMWGEDLIQIYNQGYVPIFGDKHPKSLGQPAADCWADIWNDVGPLLRGVYERGEAVYFENLLLPMQRGGRYEEAFFTFSYSPIREEDRVLGVICVVNETTAYVLREREIAERANALAELDRAKTQFFNNVSHEFRTPLTLMLGPLEDLVRTLPDYEQRERANLARRNALRLQKLVNMLLDFSSAQSGLTKARREYANLGELTSDLASEFRSAFERAGLSLTVESTADTLVPVDRTMYEKIVLNLLSNALKFTFDGGVTVASAREGDHYVLRVCDTGIGIAQEDLERLFRRFSRVQGARSRTHEGTGIGLALVHELVALQGGTIDVQSEVDRGSAFIVRLPLKADVENAVSAVDTSELRRQFVEEAETFVSQPAMVTSSVPPGAPHIIVADDNADLRMYLARLLGTRYAVTLAKDGEELVQLANQLKPDAVVADVMMPRLDGFGALQKLRENPATANTPVILLSARAGEESAVEGLSRGADDYITKPFVAADLLARIEALLRRSAGAVAPSLQRAQRNNEVLSAAADRFIVATDTATVWTAVTSALSPAFAEWAMVFVPNADGSFDPVSIHHFEQAKTDLGYLVYREFPLRIGDLSGVARAFSDKEPVLFETIPQERYGRMDTRHRSILQALGFHSCVVAPVLVAGEAVAVICLVREEANEVFTRDDCKFLEALAVRTALAYENTRAQERERTIASTLQRALLPAALPALSGVRFSAAYSPAAQESLVGGDWYDAFAVDARRVVISIGDVVGHGLHAATIMAALRQAVRGFAIENRDPGAVLASVNRLLIAENPGSLATAYVASLDTQTLEISVASAGHHAAKLLGHDEPMHDLCAEGLILGVEENARYASRTYELDPGDMLVLYTDGFVENERDIALGEARFAQALQAARSIPDTASAVHLALFGEQPPRDDAALITVSADLYLPDVDAVLPAKPESASHARSALRRFLAGIPLDDTRRFEILTAAGEAIVNSIEHAYAADGNGTVSVRAELQGDNAVIEVEDQGGTWDVETFDRVQRGYGIPLMHALSDSVEIARSLAGTRVRITCALDSAPIPAAKENARR